MNEYPAMLRLKGKKVVIIGGGFIAERKLISLLHAEANITVIAPDVTERIASLYSSGNIEWKVKSFQNEDIVDAFLIIAATNKPETNQFIYQAADEHQLINIVNDPDNSNFIVPSVFRRGRLTIAISTSGASPGLAKKLKKEIAEQYDEGFGEYIEFLHQCRTRVQQEIDDPLLRKQILTYLLEDNFLEMTREKNFSKREEIFLSLLKKVK